MGETEGGGEVALVGPKSRKTGCRYGAGGCLGGTCFGSSAELAPSPGVKSCLSDHNRGNVGQGGAERGAGESGQTGTYTTDVCSEKYRKVVMQI